MLDVVHISIVQEDDSIALMQLVVEQTTKSGDRVVLREPTVDEIEAELAKMVNLRVKSWRIIDPNIVPKDRDYRDAWRDDGHRIHHHMPLVHQAFLDRIRFHRAQRMPELDVRWSRAFAGGDLEGARSVEKKRQLLRDLPSTAVKHIESIKSVDKMPDPERFVNDVISGG